MNRHWKIKDARFIRQQIGSMDDLRYGMVLNPHMRVAISHGHFDMVTPYFSTNRIIQHMKLDESLQSNLHVSHYDGGHMSTRGTARAAFARDMQSFTRGQWDRLQVIAQTARARRSPHQRAADHGRLRRRRLA